MQTIKEYSQGEYVIGGIFKNVFGEFIVYVGTTVKRFENLQAASAMLDDYLALETREAA